MRSRRLGGILTIAAAIALAFGTPTVALAEEDDEVDDIQGTWTWEHGPVAIEYGDSFALSAVSDVWMVYENSSVFSGLPATVVPNGAARELRGSWGIVAGPAPALRPGEYDVSVVTTSRLDGAVYSIAVSPAIRVTVDPAPLATSISISPAGSPADGATVTMSIDGSWFHPATDAFTRGTPAGSWKLVLTPQSGAPIRQAFETEANSDPQLTWEWPDPEAAQTYAATLEFEPDDPSLFTVASSTTAWTSPVPATPTPSATPSPTPSASAGPVVPAGTISPVAVVGIVIASIVGAIAIVFGVLALRARRGNGVEASSDAESNAADNAHYVK